MLTIFVGFSYAITRDYDYSVQYAYSDVHEEYYPEDPNQKYYDEIEKISYLGQLECEYNAYDCDDFKCRWDAITLHDYCAQFWFWDVHWLDDDKDWKICEWSDACVVEIKKTVASETWFERNRDSIKVWFQLIWWYIAVVYIMRRYF